MFKPKHKFRLNLLLLLIFLALLTTSFRLSQTWLSKILQVPLINVPFDYSDSKPLSTKQNHVFEQARPATVQIKVFSRSIFPTFVRGMGTGFFISSDGLVLTAYHVIEEAKGKITASLANGESYNLELISFDAYRDLALLKARVDNKQVPYLDMGIYTPRLGSKVLSIGNSGGNFLSARLGQVTRLNVSAARADFAPDTIEFSSKLAPGDSGGPVLNAKGKVIGVVSYISYIPKDIIERSERFIPKFLHKFLAQILPTDHYASYAVPILKDSQIIAALLAGQKRDVPVIGIYGGNYNPKVSSQNLGPLAGALVDRVPSLSPAAQAGLRDCQLGIKPLPISKKMGCLSFLDPQRDYTINQADIIIAVNGKRTHNFGDLLATVRTHQIGDLVTLTVQRDNALVELELILGAKSKVFQ